VTDIDSEAHLDSSQGLFSTVASDNVEVVGEASNRASEGLWTVAPNHETDAQSNDWNSDDWSTADPTLQDSSDLWSDVEDDAGDDWSQIPDAEPFEATVRRPVSDATGSVFSADPVDHFEDTIDEAEVIDSGDWIPPVAQQQSNPLFSSGPERTAQPSYSGPGGASSGHAASEGEDVWEQRQSAGPDWETFSAPPPPRNSPQNGARSSTAHSWNDQRSNLGSADFETAVLRLHPEDAELAHVALSICAALLPEGESVVALVTGQMLGRPAAVMVTEYRVVIANDRRWQPVVDVFAINAELSVRGRQDREIAALSFSDRTRLSMVDGIHEVDMAVDLANLIRGPGVQSDW